MPLTNAVDERRPSVLIELDRDRALSDLRLLTTLDEIVAALPGEATLLAVDQPLVVTNQTGKRDLDELLAWIDMPAFPASTRRLTQVFGGVRGQQLTLAVGRGPVDAVETLPDLVLRVLAWREHAGSPVGDLAAFRAAWIGLRPPRYRPKGLGRADPGAIAAAAALLGRHVDLAGWRPQATGGDDWSAIRDSAIVDAAACAFAAWSVVHGEGVWIEGTGGATIVTPTTPDLTDRLAVNVDRLAAGSRPALRLRTEARA